MAADGSPVNAIGTDVLRFRMWACSFIESVQVISTVPSKNFDRLCVLAKVFFASLRLDKTKGTEPTLVKGRLHGKNV